MNTLSSILSGFAAAFTVTNLLVLIGGTILGIIFGALPGVSSTMGVAVLIPLTYGMNPVTGLIMLAGIYCGSVYGGSISAILLNTPGTPAAAATVFDGYPLAKGGQAGRALSMSVLASTGGGLIGVLFMVF
ncbi:MAG: tripartite tricarboxylate transporter permease, partial [Clostridia bacterium]|nr:tripartite tricarboxylate transporter permease [Clostridia bacterium]